MPLDSRQRILEHLKQSGHGSVAELSRALSLTPVTIRHHLEALRADGLVADPEARQKSGPGRPEMLYRATSAADGYMPRNYGELCRCLLETIQKSPASSDLETILVEMGSQLGTSHPGHRGAKVTERFLSERGYFPIVGQSEDSIEIKLANCPYLEVAKATPALCHFDRALIGALMGSEATMVGRIVDYEPHCTFQIQR